MTRVSVITVCFNSVATIRETIESVLSQIHPDIEYIIVDGGSIDGTMEVIRGYGTRISKVISGPDQGIYDAMNKGISAATGDMVCMLNSDDVYAGPTAVKQLVECMNAARTDTVFADLVLVDSKNTGRVIRYYDSSRFHPSRLRNGWMPAHPTFLAKRTLFEKWGLYSLDYRIAADYEMMVRLLYRARVSYAYLPEVVVKMRAGGLSTSGLRNSWLLNSEIVRACRENGLKTSLPRVLMKFPAKLLEFMRRPTTGVGKAIE